MSLAVAAELGQQKVTSIHGIYISNVITTNQLDSHPYLVYVLIYTSGIVAFDAL